MLPYKHTQTGMFSRITFGVLVVLSLITAVYLGPRDPKAILIFGVAAAVLMLALLLFHSLTVEVARGYLRFRFGIGLIGRQFRVKDIETAEHVRNRWWYGWGIRLTPHGWLFNVSGYDAIQIRLKNGRGYRIGTDEPEKLLAAIEAATARNR
ncbi:MAG: hypothetical protein ACR2QU_07505 [Gammaproteobacteria bacterium]